MKLKRVIGWSALAISVALVGTASVAYFTSDNSCSSRSRTDVPAHPMNAWIYCEYGSPDVLKLERVETPTPADSEVLIRVRAASVNPLDWHYMRGLPYIVRVGAGLRKPKVIRLGVDFAGTVEAVGARVTQFQPGDEVFGGRTGAFAEFIAIRADGSVALKPANMTFEQAAAVGIAGVTALQGLRDRGRVRSGQRVLINGASGGVGTFAVQIAKAFGAHVTGVNSTKNVELVRSIGADTVIDYTTEDYTKGAQRYDVILDNVGNRALSDNRRVLTPNGRYVLVGGGGANDGQWIGPFVNPIKAMIVSRFVSQELGMFLADQNQRDLTVLRDLMLAGKVTPIIDKRYPFSDVPTAVRYQETGRARGKVVIIME